MATKTAPAAAADTQIHIERLGRETINVPIVGTTPLIVHNWDEKARAMLPGGSDSSKKGRAKRVHPTAEEAFEASRYRMPDGTDGFPATAFKSAMIGAARFFDGITMTALRPMIFVHGYGSTQLVPITGDPVMREDVVRIGMGTANLRHRAMFVDWSTTLTITYLPSLLSVETVIALVDAAGMGGVGEWRPSSPKSSTGTFGQFAIEE